MKKVTLRAVVKVAGFGAVCCDGRERVEVHRTCDPAVRAVRGKKNFVIVVINVTMSLNRHKIEQVSLQNCHHKNIRSTFNSIFSF